MESGNSNIQLLSYPYSYSGAINTQWPDIKLVKQLSLNKNIVLNSIAGHSDTLLLYSAISGNLSVYSTEIDSLVAYEEIPEIIDIEISYWDFESSAFAKTLSYYTETHVIDY